jgi:hypothetical protein
LSFRLQRTYVYSECPYIKVNVRFKAATSESNGIEEDPSLVVAGKPGWAGRKPNWLLIQLGRRDLRLVGRTLPFQVDHDLFPLRSHLLQPGATLFDQRGNANRFLCALEAP